MMLLQNDDNMNTIKNKKKKKEMKIKIKIKMGLGLVLFSMTTLLLLNSIHSRGKFAEIFKKNYKYI